MIERIVWLQLVIGDLVHWLWLLRLLNLILRCILIVILWFDSKCIFCRHLLASLIAIIYEWWILLLHARIITKILIWLLECFELAMWVLLVQIVLILLLLNRLFEIICICIGHELVLWSLNLPHLILLRIHKWLIARPLNIGGLWVGSRVDLICLVYL